ncbi:Metabotropic glutamate receptor 1, partial [Taenia solium]
ACEPIDPKYPHWKDSSCLTAIVFASLGGLLTILILVVFIVYRNTAVVKASTRELMWLILVAMLFAHAFTILVLFRPSTFTCALQRTLPGLAFTAIYAALVTKTNRIARIMEGSKRILVKKQRFLSTPAQLFITGSDGSWENGDTKGLED